MKFYNCYTIMAGQDSCCFNCLDDDQDSAVVTSLSALGIASFRCDATVRRLSGASQQRAFSSAPHPAHAGADVEANTLARSAGRGPGCRARPVCLFEQAEQPIGNEARPRGVDVPVALRALAMGEETLRHHEVKLVLGACHRDIEQPAFFLDFG